MQVSSSEFLVRVSRTSVMGLSARNNHCTQDWQLVSGRCCSHPTVSEMT